MTAEGYPDDHLACSVCEAKLGDRCFSLLAGTASGIDLGRSRFMDHPHPGRKRSGWKAATEPATRTATRSPGTATVARRAARKTATTVSGWAAIAEKQAAKREGRA